MQNNVLVLCRARSHFNWREFIPLCVFQRNCGDDQITHSGLSETLVVCDDVSEEISINDDVISLLLECETEQGLPFDWIRLVVGVDLVKTMQISFYISVSAQSFSPRERSIRRSSSS